MRYFIPPIAIICLLLTVSDFAPSQQPAPPWREEQIVFDPMQMAKDKFDALHADLKKLKQARLEIALVEQDARLREFLAGRGTLDFLHDSALAVLKSQLALAAYQTEKLAALEDYWALMRGIEKVNQRRAVAGRIPTKEYAKSTYYRIDAEQRMLRARKGQ